MRLSRLWVTATMAAALLQIAERAFGQGLIDFFNSSTTLVRTNSLGTGGGVDSTATNSAGFYYGLFIAPSTVTTVSPQDLLTAAWTFTDVYATNTIATSGGRLSGGGAIRVALWDTTTNAYCVAGWSANVSPSDWASVAGQLVGASFTNGLWSGPNWLPTSAGGFFGVSALGLGFAPNFNSSLPAQPLFGPASPGFLMPIGTGFDLYEVGVPEPEAWGLVALGGAGLLWSMARHRTGRRSPSLPNVEDALAPTRPGA
jgi:hypothetical protein